MNRLSLYHLKFVIYIIVLLYGLISIYFTLSFHSSLSNQLKVPSNNPSYPITLRKSSTSHDKLQDPQPGVLSTSPIGRQEKIENPSILTSSDSGIQMLSITNNAKVSIPVNVAEYEKLKKELQNEFAGAESIFNAAKLIYEAAKSEYNAKLKDIEDVAANRLVFPHRLHVPRVHRELLCTGWKQTGNCDPYGPREPEFDASCTSKIKGGVSGYCEMKDTLTGELFRVLPLHCSSLRSHVSFSCNIASNFADFALQAEDVLNQKYANMKQWDKELVLEKIASNNPGGRPNMFNRIRRRNYRIKELRSLPRPGQGNGIIFVMYPKLLPNIYATLSVLREKFKCLLPVELWYHPGEMNHMHHIVVKITERYGPVTLRKIEDSPGATGFRTKIHAIYHSSFEKVLFLDSDNIPIRNIEFLFTLPELEVNTAIFWPDFWTPHNTIFNIHDHSLLWELVDIPSVQSFEQESGQILINRNRAAHALQLTYFYAFHQPNIFEKMVLAYGDKDLFRLAWLKSKTPFYMIPYPPALAGTMYGTSKSQFCGMTMVQHDPNGKQLFYHRNAKKLEGGVNELPLWSHIVTYKWWIDNSNEKMKPFDQIQEEFIIDILGKPKEFELKGGPQVDSCYAPKMKFYQYFTERPVNESIILFEKELIQKAHEGWRFEDPPT